MWPLFVVFNFPPVGGFPDLVQIAEQVQIENFVPIGFVKPLDIRILVWLARLNVLDHHSMFFSPGNELTTEKLWSVVGA